MPGLAWHLFPPGGGMFAGIVRAARWGIHVIERVLEYVSMCMLMMMAVIICGQVFLRYVFNHSPSWSEEVAILLMIWFGILSIPIGVKLNLHIGIEYLYRRCPRKWQYVISRFVYLLIAAFGLVMVVYGIQLTQFMTMSTLPATKLSSAVEYVVVPISGLLLIFYSLELLLTPYDRFLDQCRLDENALMG